MAYAGLFCLDAEAIKNSSQLFHSSGENFSLGFVAVNQKPMNFSICGGDRVGQAVNKQVVHRDTEKVCDADNSFDTRMLNSCFDLRKKNSAQI